MQLTKLSNIKIIHTPGKNLSVADMLSRSFTKTELQLNRLKHKQLQSQIDNRTLTPVHNLIKHEEVLPHQKHDFTQSLQIMVQINFPFVSMTKEMTLLSNLYNPSPLNL